MTITDNFLNDFQEIISLPEELMEQLQPEMKSQISLAIKDISYSFVSEPDIKQALNELDEIEKQIFDNNEVEINETAKDFILWFLNETKHQLYAKLRLEIPVNIELCNDGAKIPTYANPNDAGCDVYAIEDTTIGSYETKLIKTGLKVDVPYGWVLSVRPRSGLSLKTGLRICNAPGTIDCGYKDEVGIIIQNLSSEDYTIKKGDRIAQFLIEQNPKINWLPVDNISNENNRGGGFGSSDKK